MPAAECFSLAKLSCRKVRREVMFVTVVKLKSGLSDQDARQVAEERAPLFRAVPGLVQKYYLREPSTGDFSGIYLWESQEAMQNYFKSDLRRTIAEAYQVQGQPRVETSELLFSLRAEEPAATGAS
jgi:heme-degrading monooxygenase HmoA